MFKLSLTVIALAVVLDPAASFPALSPGPGAKINEYLVDKLPDNQNISDNLEAAALWLKEQQSAGSSDRLVSALTSFVALKGIIGEPTCDKQTYKIIRDANAVADHRPFKRKLEGLRRIDFVVQQVGREVAETCHKQHSDKLAGKLVTLNKELIDRAKNLEEFTNRYAFTKMFRRLSELQYSDVSGIHFQHYTGLMMSIAQGLYGNRDEDPDLQYMAPANNEKTGRRTVNKAKVKEISDKYIMEPCKYLDSHLGSLIRMADQDEKIMGAFNTRWLTETGSPFLNLVPTLRLCHIFLKKGQDKVAAKASEVASRLK